MSDVPFDDPAGRTRFAWARTLMVMSIAALVIERLFFADSWWSAIVLGLPVVTVGALTLIRSRPLRNEPRGVSAAFPTVVLSCVLLLACAAALGVMSR